MIFETLGRIFSPNGELPKPTHKLCRYCDCFHEIKIGEFWDEKCEQGYNWEYEQDFINKIGNRKLNSYKMAINATLSKWNTPRELIPAGNYIARCYKMIEIGTVEGKN